MTAAPSRRPSVWRFYLLHAGAAVLLAAAMLVAIEALRLDWRLSDWYFDPVLGRFPLRDHALLERVVHSGFKNAVVGIALVTAAAWAASFRVSTLVRFRPALLYVFLAMLLATTSVSVLKAGSGRHCPYDLQRYGGTVPFTGLLEPLPAEVKPGKCWPGGHASSGFSLFALYFSGLWLGRRGPALAGLTAALALGFGVGLGRVAQGAHFLSHNVWSALVCWLVALALYEALLRRRPYR